ncbi:MAG: PH domain-containing protein [Bdellovibrionota bacterium]
MPIEKQLVNEQLKAIDDFHRFFTSREIKYLPEVLSENEIVNAITSGFYQGKTWIVVITNARIIFLDKGWFFRLRQLDLPLSQVSSVAQAIGVFFGEIEVSTPAGKQKISSIPKKDVIKVSSILSGLIHKLNTKQPAHSGRMDLAAQLEKVASLHERGFLTEQEFEASKKKLLDPPL